MKTNKPLRVIELFAGVGGFRLGLEGIPGEPTTGDFRVVWSNQWEPRTRIQHASMIYEKRFGKDGHSNEDIASIDVSTIPAAEVLVGGFPCQDYSVANTLKNSKGLIGQKGVLWWQIHRILSEKGKHKPHYLILENVDRLLKSPASQRGRDFAVMLSSLGQLGYSVEWLVVNAADYGMPQKRRRVFILAYYDESLIGQSMRRTTGIDWIQKEGILNTAFPGELSTDTEATGFELGNDLVHLSESFNRSHFSLPSPFKGSGVFMNGSVHTYDRLPTYSGEYMTLGDVLEKGEVDQEYYVDNASLERWQYMKGAKREKRVNNKGHKYNYIEGAISFPDDLCKPSRTIITSEGGKGPSRFKHIIKTADGRYRRLSPVELERLNMFPDDFTNITGVSPAKRAFIMGNALIVGVVARIAKAFVFKLEECSC